MYKFELPERAENETDESYLRKACARIKAEMVYYAAAFPPPVVYEDGIGQFECWGSVHHQGGTWTYQVGIDFVIAFTHPPLSSAAVDEILEFIENEEFDTRVFAVRDGDELEARIMIKEAQAYGTSVALRCTWI